MKLASLKDGHLRDGALVVVSADLTRCIRAGMTMQHALDNWDAIKPQLEALSAKVNGGGGEAFDESTCASSLPRAYQWADGSAYINHVELVRKARGAEVMLITSSSLFRMIFLSTSSPVWRLQVPASFYTDPLMYQGGSDTFLGPREDIVMHDQAWGIDFEAEVCVITGDVPMGAKPDECGQYIKLLTLVNDVSLRALIPGEVSHIPPAAVVSTRGPSPQL